MNKIIEIPKKPIDKEEQKEYFKNLKNILLKESHEFYSCCEKKHEGIKLSKNPISDLNPRKTHNTMYCYNSMDASILDELTIEFKEAEVN